MSLIRNTYILIQLKLLSVPSNSNVTVEIAEKRTEINLNYIETWTFTIIFSKNVFSVLGRAKLTRNKTQKDTIIYMPVSKITHAKSVDTNLLCTEI